MIAKQSGTGPEQSGTTALPLQSHSPDIKGLQDGTGCNGQAPALAPTNPFASAASGAPPGVASTDRPVPTSDPQRDDGRVTATAPVSLVSTPATRSPRRVPLTSRQRDAARLDAEGATVEAITTTVKTTRSALARWRALPGYAQAVTVARGTLVREADVLRIAARHKALSVAVRLLDGDPDEALVRAVLASTQPDGHERDARVRAGLLRRLPPALRSQVVEHLDDGDQAALSAMTDDEITAALSAAERKDPRP